MDPDLSEKAPFTGVEVVEGARKLLKMADEEGVEGMARGWGVGGLYGDWPSGDIGIEYPDVL